MTDCAKRDLADCAARLSGGSRTFLLASYLLPKAVRRDAIALYAFCRIADDLIDHDGTRATLVQLQGRLDRLIAATPDDACADRALSRVVQRHHLSRAALHGLLEGFGWDLDGRRYATILDVERYCLRVAGTVGVLMAQIMGVADERALLCACELGMAMQLSNIARDVGEDARMGRLYLPTEWMAEAGLDADVWSAAPCFDARLGGVVAKLLARADGLYRRAARGIDALPRACRPAIRIAASLYAEIGAEICRNHHDSVTRRAVVRPARKARVMARSAYGAPFGAVCALSVPSAAALDFAALVAAEVPALSTSAREDSLYVRVFHIFERIERRDRELRRRAGESMRLGDLGRLTP